MTLVAALISTIFFYVSLLADDSFFYFIPPTGWQPVKEEQQAASIKGSFFSPSSGMTCSSINIAEEITSLDFTQYIQAVQKRYISSKTTWRNLGAFATPAGTGTLTSIDIETPIDKMRVLQLLVPCKDRVVLLTAASPKKEFSKVYPHLITSFRSLTHTNNVESSLLSPEKLPLLQQTLQKSSLTLEALSRFLTEKFAEQGPYWQAQVLAKFLAKNQENHANVK